MSVSGVKAVVSRTVSGWRDAIASSSSPMSRSSPDGGGVGTVDR
jgi:hypothetical protein